MFSIKTYFVTHQNLPVKMILKGHNMFSWRNKKKHFRIILGTPSYLELRDMEMWKRQEKATNFELSEKWQLWNFYCND